MSFMDKVKAKADEWDVQGRAEKLAAEIEKVAHEAKDKAATLADENRDKVATTLDKAGAKLDERTEGKYADKIVKAKQSVAKGVDKLAEQRPGGPQGQPSATGGAAPNARPSRSTTGAVWSEATGGAYPQDAPAPPPPPSQATTSQASSPEPYTPEPYVSEPIDDAAPLEPRQPDQTGTGWPQDAPPTAPDGHPT